MKTLLIALCILLCSQTWAANRLIAKVLDPSKIYENSKIYVLFFSGENHLLSGSWARMSFQITATNPEILNVGGVDIACSDSNSKVVARTWNNMGAQVNKNTTIEITGYIDSIPKNLRSVKCRAEFWGTPAYEPLASVEFSISK